MSKDEYYINLQGYSYLSIPPLASMKAISALSGTNLCTLSTNCVTMAIIRSSPSMWLADLTSSAFTRSKTSANLTFPWNFPYRLSKRLKQQRSRRPHSWLLQLGSRPVNGSACYSSRRFQHMWHHKTFATASTVCHKTYTQQRQGPRQFLRKHNGLLHGPLFSTSWHARPLRCPPTTPD